MPSRPRRPGAVRALAVFWSVILIVCVAGAATLQVLGPPLRPGPAVAMAELPLPPPSTAWDGRIVAPVAALLEPSKAFPPAALPRVAADGRVPRQIYARPAPPADGRPRIALVLAGLGLSEADSRTAIERLPGAVTLAFSPYAVGAEGLLDAARVGGHELLASVPMEPQNFPSDTAGTHSLMTGASPQENGIELEWVLGRMQGYAGLTGASDGMRGERYAALTSGFRSLLEEAAGRGLLYFDPRPTAGERPPHPVPGVSYARADLVLDDPLSRAGFEAKLATLERLARERGSAIGLAGPIRPATIERIASWVQEVEGRGIVLVPVSALATIAEETR